MGCARRIAAHTGLSASTFKRIYHYRVAAFSFYRARYLDSSSLSNSPERFIYFVKSLYLEKQTKKQYLCYVYERNKSAVRVFSFL